MALSQKLAPFKQQQEQLQASLAKTPVARPTPPPQSKAPAVRKAPLPPPSQSAVPFAQRFSFATDKHKPQQIAAIQRAPVGAQMKKVLDILLETRQALLPSEIHGMCFVDVAANKDVFESLKSNPEVSFDGQRFAYKRPVIFVCRCFKFDIEILSKEKSNPISMFPSYLDYIIFPLSKHNVKNKAGLLVLIRSVLDGMPMGDLKDSYPGVLSDVQELKAAGDIWVLMNTDSQEDIAYPNDSRIKIKIDEDLKQLVRSIELPREFIDVEWELTKASTKPVTNSASREVKGTF